ncbi:hypothetical protein EAH78_21890 [Pseudomonas arsenicoxydans]|uniref:Uncharacterized protein n=1 Tax=Pseudomonas arsenicoxydans TaxID=702115 RepID=A0A502HNR7_9PSED|nr:hypothetical protein EAH78_21890 [Pseudomonas arsenicoxydans]
MTVPYACFATSNKDAPSGRRVQVIHKTNVGAVLLANAVCQSTFKLNDTPHSRASPLPQGITVAHRVWVSNLWARRQINRGDGRGSS